MNKTLVCLFAISLLLINITSTVKPTDNNLNFNSNDEFYGYIINVDINQNNSVQLNITRLVISLLKENLQVYWLAFNITIESVKLINSDSPIEKYFLKGSFIVSFTDNESKNAEIKYDVSFFSNLYNLEVYEILNPLNNLDIYKLVEPKIAIYGCDSADQNGYLDILIDAGIHPYILSSNYFYCLNESNFNIFIWGALMVPYRDAVSDTLSKNGLQFRTAIRDFIRNGGTYVGSCYGGWMAASGFKRPRGLPLDLGFSPSLNLLPMQLDLIDSYVYRALPGAGNVTIQIIDKDSPLSYGLPEFIDKNIYYAGPMFLKKNSESKTKTIGVIHEIDQEKWFWDYMTKASPWWKTPILSKETKMNIAEKWIEKSIGQAIWITDNYGAGKVIAFGTHPEYKKWDILGQDTPVRIVYNAIFYGVSSDLKLVDINMPVIE